MNGKKKKKLEPKYYDKPPLSDVNDGFSSERTSLKLEIQQFGCIFGLKSERFQRTVYCYVNSHSKERTTSNIFNPHQRSFDVF